MKFKGIVVAAALALTAGQAQAQNAILQITGRVTAPTCSLSVGDVAFGDVPMTNFLDEQYAREFQVSLGTCDMSTLTRATLKFSGTTVPGIVNNTGLALSGAGAGAAQGVAVSVYVNENTHGGVVGTAVRFDNSTEYPFAVTSGKNTYNFRAKLVSVPGVSLRTGTANATATVTLSYS